MSVENSPLETAAKPSHIYDSAYPASSSSTSTRTDIPFPAHIVSSIDSAPPPQNSQHFSPMLLFQIAIFNIGSHYNQHVLSSLSPSILSTFNANRLAYGALFSSEEFATVILCAAGLALVYTPLPQTAATLTILVLISTILTAVALIPPPSYTLLIISRFFFGFSQGLLTTVQAAILADQFPHRVGTAFGVMLLTSRLSSFAGLTLPATLSATFGLHFSLWFAACTAIPPVISSLNFAICHRRAHRRRRSVSISSSSYAPIPVDVNTNVDGSEDNLIVMREVPSSSSPCQIQICFSTFLKTVKVVVSSFWYTLATDLRHAFPSSYWLCCLLWVVFSGVVYTILHFSVDILSPRLQISPAFASLFSALLMLIAGLSSPFIGTVQDRLSNRARVLFYCCAILMLGCSVYMIALVSAVPNGIFSKVMMSLAYLLYTLGFAAGPVTLMSCVALIVPANAMPAALAFYKATESIGLALLHMTFGYLRDWSVDYVLPLAMLALLAAAGMLFAAILEKCMMITKHDAFTMNSGQQSSC